MEIESAASTAGFTPAMAGSMEAARSQKLGLAGHGRAFSSLERGIKRKDAKSQRKKRHQLTLMTPILKNRFRVLSRRPTSVGANAAAVFCFGVVPQPPLFRRRLSGFFY